MHKKLIVIAGPTAVGKTAIAIEVAKHLDTEIVSADSRQCYREMMIGTAKPTDKELAAVKHHFISDHSVQEAISAADYERIALDHLDTIFSGRNKAILCGGTGLYIKALCEGLDDMPKIKPGVAAEIQQQYEAQGIKWLQETIALEDPLFYSKGEVLNPARLIRALVFVRSNGESIIRYQNQATKNRDFEIIKIGIELEREQLYARINQRVDSMMEDGLLKEAERLYPLQHLKNLQTVGYTELFDFLDGNYSLDEAVAKIKQHTRNYAKRQLTWFKKDKSIMWLDAGAKGLLEKIITISS